MNKYVIQEAISFPVLLSDAKKQINIIEDDDDVFIDHLIQVATAYAEEFTGIKIMPQIWELALDEIECSTFALGFTPIQSVDSVKYDDESNTEQTLADTEYNTDFVSTDGRIHSDNWPSTYNKFNAIRIRMTVGYVNADAVPAPIKHAILMLVSQLYENRENTVVGLSVSEMPYSMRMMLLPYRYKLL